MWMSRECYVHILNAVLYIFVNCINQNGNIDEYGYNIRVEVLGIVTWFQVDSELGTEVKE